MNCFDCKHRVWLQGVSRHVCTACEDGQIPDDSLLHYYVTKTQHPKCPFLFNNPFTNHKKTQQVMPDVR